MKWFGHVALLFVILFNDCPGGNQPYLSWAVISAFWCRAVLLFFALTSVSTFYLLFFCVLSFSGIVWSYLLCESLVWRKESFLFWSPYCYTTVLIMFHLSGCCAVLSAFSCHFLLFDYFMLLSSEGSWSWSCIFLFS